MNLYLDEDMNDVLLVRLLRRAGHNVETPVDTGLLGKSDAVQLAYSIRARRAILSYNYKDFKELHDLIGDATGTHLGILVVRQENDPTRDLSEKGIVTAIRKLEASGVPIRNEYVILNKWR